MEKHRVPSSDIGCVSRGIILLWYHTYDTCIVPQNVDLLLYVHHTRTLVRYNYRYFQKYCGLFNPKLSFWQRDSIVKRRKPNVNILSRRPSYYFLFVRSPTIRRTFSPRRSTVCRLSIYRSQYTHCVCSWIQLICRSIDFIVFYALILLRSYSIPNSGLFRILSRRWTARILVRRPLLRTKTSEMIKFNLKYTFCSLITINNYESNISRTAPYDG